MGETQKETLGKYEILSKIGEGGFGAVFKARDPHLKRIVAIKTCTDEDAELRKRFLREGEIVASLQHPNITLIHDLGFDGDTPFLVQELLSGEDLTGVIAREEPLSEETRIGWLIGVARGLEYAHAHGIVHRDIKPANVRITDEGLAKIMDFGIARLAHQETRLTKTGLAIGTIAYMSPEQLDGSEVDHRSDIFAFGILAYELLAYGRPFDGDTTSRIVYQILHAEPRLLANVSPRFGPGLDQIVRGCLAKSPKSRFQSMGDVAASLERLRSGQPPIDDRTAAGWKIALGDAQSAAAGMAPTERFEIAPGSAIVPAPGPGPATGTGAYATSAGAAAGGSGKRTLKLAVAVGVAVVAGLAIAAFLRRDANVPPAEVESVATAASATIPSSPAGAPEQSVEPDPIVPAAAEATAPAKTPASTSPAPAPQKPAPADDRVGALVERAQTEARAARSVSQAAQAPELAAGAYGIAQKSFDEGTRAFSRGQAEAAYDAFVAARSMFEAAAREAESTRASRASTAPAQAASSPAPAVPPAAAPAAEISAETNTAPTPTPPASAEAAQAEIQRLLDAYVTAYERLSATDVVAAVPSMAPRRAALERAFASYRSLDLRLERCRFAIEDDRGSVTCDKRQSFELKVGQSQPIEGRIVFRLVKRSGRWSIDAIEG